jgi:hydroxyacylglutathione hydrolase
MRLRALPALEDNYVWVLGDLAQAVIIDPGEAAPVLALAAQGLHPQAILITHHHRDHWGGVAELLGRWPGLPVYAPHEPRIELDCRRVSDGERIQLDGLDVDTIAVPGHTLSHVAYLAGDNLFCGDALFSLGCGRMFEGNAVQMHASLQRLAALPGHTRVCAAHEYTLANAAFSLAVEPDNTELQQRQAQVRALRQAGQATLPSTMASERACNPFLRCAQPGVRASARQRLGREPENDSEVFAALRQWKDVFRP